MSGYSIRSASKHLAEKNELCVKFLLFESLRKEINNSERSIYVKLKIELVKLNDVALRIKIF